MALESCESSINVDIFSNLPDEIDHKIMSFLSFKDLTRFGSVSKRCKNLRLSTPYINFDVPRGENGGKMLDSFNSFMIQRGDNRILKFVFSYFYVRDGTENEDVKSPAACCEKLRFREWINSATKCNAEELSIQVYPPRDTSFSLISGVFLCQSLRSLWLTVNFVIGGEVSSFPCLSNLASLFLASVSVIDESFWRWISCSCICLQTLSLLDIHGSKNIIIESPSLKKFSFSLLQSDCCNLSIFANRLENISIKWGYYSRNSSLNISAPNATRFDWSGPFPSRQYIGEMRCLNEGLISCCGEVTKLTDLLYCLRCVKTLELNDRVLKALSIDGSSCAPLDDVRFLKVTCILTDDLVPGLLCLLQRTPSLTSLCLMSMTNPLLWPAVLYNSRGFDMEWWKLQKLAFVDRLKSLAIFMNGSNIFEFARSILKDARNLERMDIFCVPGQSDDVIKLQDEMISKEIVIFHQVVADSKLYSEISKFLKHLNKYC